MTVAATLQTIHDGARNLVVKAHLSGDGTDASEVQLIDASAYSAPVPGVGASLKLMKVEYALDQFAVTLSWDASSNVEFLTLPPGSDTLDFTDIGGLINNAGSGITGDIDFSTVGNATGEDGFIVLHMRKRAV